MSLAEKSRATEVSCQVWVGIIFDFCLLKQFGIIKNDRKYIYIYINQGVVSIYNVDTHMTSDDVIVSGVDSIVLLGDANVNIK